MRMLLRRAMAGAATAAGQTTAAMDQTNSDSGLDGASAMLRPQLKEVRWERDGEQLRMVYDVRDHFLLHDPDEAVEKLLELLRAGGRTIDELAEALTDRGREVTPGEVAAVVGGLDAQGLVEDGRRLGRFGPDERERYFSNLAFFESFGSLSRSREDLQQMLRDSHVLVLGTGGLNSNTIPHLCGLGVGRLTLLDRDEVELRNFARQYLFRYDELGARKVGRAADWARRFDPTIKVEALDASVDGPQDVLDLLDRFVPDAVMSGVDSPHEIDDWVNDGCAGRGVPYVRGGMYVTQGSVWSVDPGASACRTCARAAGDRDAGEDGARIAEEAAFALYREKPRANRGIGPVAGLLGALCAFEVLRYLTRFEPPAYAGRRFFIDFADGCTTRYSDPWPRDSACRVCGSGSTGDAEGR